jgi:hypothetical protein
MYGLLQCGLTQWFARTVGSWIPVPLGASMYVCICSQFALPRVCRGQCDGLMLQPGGPTDTSDTELGEIEQCVKNGGE